MTGFLNGKTALVTGGGGGIGHVAALAFAREGARVAVADLNEDAARQTVDAIRTAKGEAIAVPCDVSNSEEVQKMIAATVSRYDRLDYAFNNAGLGSAQLGTSNKQMVEWPDDAFDRMISVNLRGVFLCMKHELRQMLKQGGGAIVNTSSIAGVVGVVGGAGYNAAKHGVIGLTQTAALEYAEGSIRVNAVCPGPIKTPMNDSTLSAMGGFAYEKFIPLRRRGTPEDVAELVLFLCSDRAAFITGAVVPVDGGWLAQ